MSYLLRHDASRYMKSFGSELRHTVWGFVWWTIVFAASLGFQRMGARWGASNSAGIFMGGLVLSLAVFMTGLRLHGALVSGGDAQLFGFMPLTTGRFFLQNVKYNLAYLAPPAIILIGEPLVILFSRDVHTFLRHANLSLTLLALLLYPFALNLLPRTQYWDVFFFARRLIQDLIRMAASALRAESLEITWRQVTVALTIAALCVIQLRLPFLSDVVWRLVETGVPARIGIFVFSPLSGLPFLAADMSAGASGTLAVCLAAANIGMIAMISRVFCRNMEEIERVRFAEWREMRDYSEAVDAYNETETYIRFHRPVQERSAALARKDVAAQPGAEAEPYPTLSNPAIDDVQIVDELGRKVFGNGGAEKMDSAFPEYDTALSPCELIERERQSWNHIRWGSAHVGLPARQMLKRRILQGAAIACVLTFMGGAAFSQHGTATRSIATILCAITAVAQITLALPYIVIKLQTAGVVNLLVYAHIAPIRWGEITARMNAWGGRWLVVINVASGIALGWLAGGRAHVAATVFVFLAQRTGPLLYWLDSRRQIGNWGSDGVATNLWLGAFICSVILPFSVLIPNARGFMITTTILLLIGNICLLGSFAWCKWSAARERRRHSDQVMLLPGYLPNPIIR